MPCLGNVRQPPVVSKELLAGELSGDFHVGDETERMPRYLHTSIFVNDMAASIDFYTKKLGLRLLDGPLHYPGNADMAFVGSDWNAYVELVYDLEDHPPYELGNRYEHLAFEVDGDVPSVVDRLESQGVRVLQRPKKSPGGARTIAFIEDPNGIPVELLEARVGSGDTIT